MFIRERVCSFIRNADHRTLPRIIIVYTGTSDSWRESNHVTRFNELSMFCPHIVQSDPELNMTANGFKS